MSTDGVPAMVYKALEVMERTAPKKTNQAEAAYEKAEQVVDRGLALLDRDRDRWELEKGGTNGSNKTDDTGPTGQ